jgi:adenosylcobinamide-phosphate synthase
MSVATYFLICALQTGIGLLVDRAFGDPQWRAHPARLVGRFVLYLQPRLRRSANLRIAGAWLAALTLGAAAGGAALLMLGCGVIDAWIARNGAIPWALPWCTVIAGGGLCGIWFSWRSLADAVRPVLVHLKMDDLDAAREVVSQVVARDTDSMDEEAVARAAVETVAENSIDGGLSPVFWSLLGGPVLVSAFKAASTLDSMVGYRSPRYRAFGCVSARLDDAFNYIPARLGLLLFPLAAWSARLKPFQAIRIGVRDGQQHPSPNAGIAEACFAGALGIQLGGTSHYDGVPSLKPLLGDPGTSIQPEAIARANRLLLHARGWVLLVTILHTIGLLCTILTFP